MNQSLSLDDLIEFDADLGNGLKAILDCDSPTLKDDLVLNFVYEYQSCWGEDKKVLLKPDGENIFVDQSNKHEYVDLMVDYILNKSVEKYFKKFHFGFHLVCKGQFLFTFEPEELELMICGNPILDFKAL
jgi:hypothetical protein